MGISIYAEERDQKLEELESLTAKLELQERFFDMFLHQCPFVIWLKDYTHDEGRMLFISDKYTDIFGVSEKDYVDRLDKDVWPQTVAQYFRKQDLEVIETGEDVYRVEPTPLADDAAWKRCHTLKFPIRDREGRVVAVGGIAWPVGDGTIR